MWNKKQKAKWNALSGKAKCIKMKIWELDRTKGIDWQMDREIELEIKELKRQLELIK